MDEDETKPCPNCKREIPAVNFTIHSVHCARNIKICPVCKEPVPSAELDDHHKKLHKLLPCKQCGESVCGTDLEDHIRDSCANTVKSCRYCELELPRRELPVHEGYCGVRTEQCPDCKEYVMIKYQQLHLDSNHGFIRLDDDPVPPKKDPCKLNLSRPKTNLNRPNVPNGPKVENTTQRPTSVLDFRPSDNISHNLNRPNSELTPSTFGNPRPKQLNFGLGSSESGPSSSNSRPSSSSSKPSSSNSGPSSSNSRPSIARPDSMNGVVSSNSTANSVINPRPGSFNDRSGSVFATPIPISNNTGSPIRFLSNTNHGSSNTNHGSSNISQGSSNTSHGSPINQSSSTSNNRPSNFNIAGHNRNKITKPVKNGSSYVGGGASSSNVCGQDNTTSVVRAGVKKRTNDQPQINMDTAATKTVEKDLGVSRGAVKKRPAPLPPAPAPAPRGPRDLPYYSAMQRQQREERERREQNEYNLAHGLPPVLNPAQKIEKLRKLDALQNRDYEEEYRSRQRRPEAKPEPPYQPPEGHTLGHADEATRQEFKNLKPMSPTQFMRRFSSLQVAPEATPGDRYPEIRSSLRELRRGLNEVTAPYNTNNMAVNNNNDRVRTPSPDIPEDEVGLPCEFCGQLMPADDLVQHQTGCRPDLARLLPADEAASTSPPAPSSPSPPSPPSPSGDPVIPCEFCMRSLPVYLIIEHQVRCIRENMPA